MWQDEPENFPYYVRGWSCGKIRTSPTYWVFRFLGKRPSGQPLFCPEKGKSWTWFCFHLVFFHNNIMCTHGDDWQWAKQRLYNNFSWIHSSRLYFFVNLREEEIKGTMNRRERTLSPRPTCTRRLLPRAPYRNQSLIEWRDPDHICKDPVSRQLSEVLAHEYDQPLIFCIMLRLLLVTIGMGSKVGIVHRQ